MQSRRHFNKCRSFEKYLPALYHEHNLWWSSVTWPQHAPLIPALLMSVCVTLCSSWLPLKAEQNVSATWQQPLEPVSIRVMYSLPFSCLPSRAANFLLLGYTNYCISILHWAAAGSWGSTRHWWPLQAVVITTEKLSAIVVWVCQTHAASGLSDFGFFPFSHCSPPNLRTKLFLFLHIVLKHASYQIFASFYA